MGVEAASQDDRGCASAGWRVLAAEDNPTNRIVLASIMEMFGVAVEIVGDGGAAVETWRRGGFDLILMDVKMPGLDGMQATRAIRSIESAEQLRRTPIVMLSANAMASQVSDYLAAGADSHVAKPIELNSLRAAMRQALARVREDAPA